jgi:hypothetical protein
MKHNGDHYSWQKVCHLQPVQEPLPRFSRVLFVNHVVEFCKMKLMQTPQLLLRLFQPKLPSAMQVPQRGREVHSFQCNPTLYAQRHPDGKCSGGS